VSAPPYAATLLVISSVQASVEWPRSVYEGMISYSGSPTRALHRRVQLPARRARAAETRPVCARSAAKRPLNPEWALTYRYGSRAIAVAVSVFLISGAGSPTAARCAPDSLGGVEGQIKSVRLLRWRMPRSRLGTSAVLIGSWSRLHQVPDRRGGVVGVSYLLLQDFVRPGGGSFRSPLCAVLPACSSCLRSAFCVPVRPSATDGRSVIRR